MQRFYMYKTHWYSRSTHWQRNINTSVNQSKNFTVTHIQKNQESVIFFILPKGIYSDSRSMAEELQKHHLYYDDINKIRILETNVSKETDDLKDTCKEYDTKVQDFGKIINSLLEVLKELGENVEKQKMAAIGSMNLLKSIAKEKESQQAKLQAELNDKTLILEQLDSEYDSLQILEATQMETIEYLTQLR